MPFHKARCRQKLLFWITLKHSFGKLAAVPHVIVPSRLAQTAKFLSLLSFFFFGEPRLQQIHYRSYLFFVLLAYTFHCFFCTSQQILYSWSIPFQSVHSSRGLHSYYNISRCYCPSSLFTLGRQRKEFFYMEVGLNRKAFIFFIFFFFMAEASF